KKIVVLKKEKIVEVYSKVKISEFIESINGKIEKDIYVDTSKVGKHIVNFTYTNDDHIKVEYSFEIKVVDTTPPIIGVSNKTVNTDYDGDLFKEFFCGDNYDDKPKCKIEGQYNTTTKGKYDLVFTAKDKSGNESSQSFTLTVKEKEPKKETEQSTNPVYKKYEDVVKEYKNKNTMIGLDLSYWQGNIDFKKLKKNGVEFLFIRVGSENKEGEFFVDKKFEEYMKGAKENNIPVGIYYYSYADSKSKAKKEAKWVIRQIKKYDVDLPVVFDWENWNHYRDYNLSFHSLTEVADTFLETIENAGYDGMLYSSKYYLENIWYPMKYQKWLAHYTTQTDYQGKYKVWQICSNGKIDGIPDNLVDIDIMLKK
ncbi:MAG: hypothetical protein IJ193_04835, partial [Bacilli bacterium]|nr:hypothetical protein [Bacilli bacterium]